MPEHGGEVECPVYSRDSLRPGHHLAGPAIIEQMDTTTVVLPEMVGAVDKHLNLILEFPNDER
jgi:N-methylhydantoinase A